MTVFNNKLINYSQLIRFRFLHQWQEQDYFYVRGVGDDKRKILCKLNYFKFIFVFDKCYKILNFWASLNPKQPLLETAKLGTKLFVIFVKILQVIKLH